MICISWPSSKSTLLFAGLNYTHKSLIGTFPNFIYSMHWSKEMILEKSILNGRVWSSNFEPKLGVLCLCHSTTFPCQFLLMHVLPIFDCLTLNVNSIIQLKEKQFSLLKRKKIATADSALTTSASAKDVRINDDVFYNKLVDLRNVSFK